MNTQRVTPLCPHGHLVKGFPLEGDNGTVGMYGAATDVADRKIGSAVRDFNIRVLTAGFGEHFHPHVDGMIVVWIVSSFFMKKNDRRRTRLLADGGECEVFRRNRWPIHRSAGGGRMEQPETCDQDCEKLGQCVLSADFLKTAHCGDRPLRELSHHVLYAAGLGRQ